MKLEKKHWIIIGVVVAIIVIWYCFRKKTESNYKAYRKISGTTGTTGRLASVSPIEDCMKKCQINMPREYCVSYCTGGQDTQPTATF